MWERISKISTAIVVPVGTSIQYVDYARNFPHYDYFFPWVCVKLSGKNAADFEGFSPILDLLFSVFYTRHMNHHMNVNWTSKNMRWAKWRDGITIVATKFMDGQVPQEERRLQYHCFRLSRILTIKPLDSTFFHPPCRFGPVSHSPFYFATKAIPDDHVFWRKNANFYTVPNVIKPCGLDNFD